MTEAKRGRPRKVRTEDPAVVDPAYFDAGIGALTVKVANAIHDGKGGFLPVGAKFDAVDGESLKAKGLAE